MSDKEAKPKKRTQPVGTVNINMLGYFLDGWADLAEGMGDKEEEVSENIFQQLKDREMPEVRTRIVTGTVGLTSESRIHAINETSPGATTTIYIRKNGIDLYAAWRTYIQPVLNQTMLLAALAVSAVLGFLTGGLNQSGGVFGPRQTTFSFWGWILATIGFAILAALVLAFAGRIIKGNFLSYFFIEPTIFDADDITAMSLSTHKSVLRALDKSGIDTSKLRLKRDFKGGRRGETV